VPAAPSTLSPQWLGIKFFFIDFGIFVVLASPVLIMGVLGVQSENVSSISSDVMLVVAAISGVYVSYLLYQTCADVTALIALILASLVFYTATTFQNAVGRSGDPVDFLLNQARSIVAYVLGWYLARTTPLQLYRLRAPWLKTLFIIGVFLGAILLIAALGKTFTQ